MPSSYLRRSVFCNVLLLVFVLLLAIVLFPLGRDDVYKTLNPLVLVTRLPIWRHRDPLSMKITSASISSLLHLGPEAGGVDDKPVFEFVDTHVLPDYDKPTDEKAKAFFEAVETKKVTPLHASMLLMGCYGYIYNDAFHQVEGQRSTRDVLGNIAIWTEYTTAFLLQALETKNGLMTTHDRSACSCMKDFASPTILILKDDEEVLDKALSDKTQDTCIMQKTIDYALDGADTALTVKTPEDLKKSVMFEPLPLNGPAKRQRSDPLRDLLTTTLASRTGTDTLQEQDRKFIVEYCKIVTDCGSTWVSTTETSTTVTNAQFFAELLLRARSVMPHNKLRPPQLCEGKTVCANNLAQDTRNQLSYASYNTYIQKYREAFYTCSNAGVPQYTTLKLGSMDSHTVYTLGQNFLFLAAIFAFTWSYLIAFYVTEVKMMQCGFEWSKTKGTAAQSQSHITLWQKLKQEYDEYNMWAWTGTLIMAFSWVWVIISFVEGFHYFSWNRLDDDDTKGQLTHVTDNTSAFFTVFIIAVFVVFSLVLMLVYYKFWERNSKLRQERQKTIGVPRGQEVRKEDLFGTESAPFSSIIKMLPHNPVEGSHFFGVSPEERIKAFNNLITAHLQDMAPYAQVGLDLTVIAGLIVLAVGVVAQRGVQDINVLSATSVLFLVIGLIAHLSNMLRLMHVYLQYDANTQYNDHVKKAAHHRVYIAVLLAVMLLVYICLAGMDAATTTSSHGSAHQFFFALLTLAVLCGADLLEHVLQKPHGTTDEDTKATTERFWMHLSTKGYYMAWLLVLALVFLHVHRAMGICEATPGKPALLKCLFLIKQ